ncbi:vWA domain-containing protein [Umezakia ovalisporum]|uniref:vWA domain-containing protein n=1 Tax=Umezakia ovalisporum TaxID=75695 RepID=UPI0035B808D3
MQKIFRILRRNKPLLFAIYGAMGCLMAAMLLGEPLLALTKLAPAGEQTSQAIVLLIDTSSSMIDGKLTEVKTAATRFIQRRNLDQDQLAVVSFGLEVNTVNPLTNNVTTLENAITSLSENGGTPMAEGIDAAVAELQSTNLQPNILLFTDGIANDPDLAYNSAQVARNEKINLIAVATGDADINYLTQLTGDESLVFYADSGNFDQAFRNAEAAIYKQLVESSATGDYGLLYSVLRIGAWTAFLAMGISLSLIVGQNQYMHRPWLTVGKGSVSTIGSLAAGMIAGSVSQLLFFPLSSISILEHFSRIIGWVILGALVGGGTQFFVPNLKLKNALFGGGVGGTIGAIGFVTAANAFGDIFGRLWGTSILGFFIGLMIAWVEQKQLSQEPYLLVHWTSTEKTSYLLGKKPILIGSSFDAQIPLNASAGFTPITAKIYREKDDIIMEFDERYAAKKNMTKLMQQLNIGDKRKFGNITLEVKSSAVNE